VDELHGSYARVKQGRFQAQMQVGLINEGPVTFLLES
jgi:D-Tyr-tRNAtyr deacylase